MGKRIDAAIHFMLGWRWAGWPAEMIAPVDLEEGDEAPWFMADDDLEVLSVEAMLRKPASKPGLTFSLEQCRWQGTRSQRIREWLSRWIPSLSPWRSVTEVTIGAGVIKPVKKEWPTPAALVPGDCWRVFIKETGKESPGAGLNVMVRVRNSGS